MSSKNSKDDALDDVDVPKIAERAVADEAQAAESGEDVLEVTELSREQASLELSQLASSITLKDLGSSQQEESQSADEEYARIRNRIAEIEAHFPDLALPRFSTEAAEPDDYLPAKKGGTVTPPTASHVTKPHELPEPPISGGGTVGVATGPITFEPIERRIVAALAAKGFVICSGPSGTGKSRTFIRLIEALARHEYKEKPESIFAFVPVEAGWTDPKRLLGFKSPFGATRTTSSGTTNDTYEITDTLRILLRASAASRSEVPHFILLDEMNLSHVERYFSPFLSLMEAAASCVSQDYVYLIDPITIKLIAEVLNATEHGSIEASAAAELASANKGLGYLPNLFIVGTVNIDETTYMFSPKVLDRAHVIEIRTQKPSDLLSGKFDPLTQYTSLTSAGTLLKEVIRWRASGEQYSSTPIQRLMGLEREGVPRPLLDEASEEIVKALDGFYKLLEPVGFDFGARVVNEVFLYSYLWMTLALRDGVPASDVTNLSMNALDEAVLQKLLPKLHGNKRSLGNSLVAMASFADGHDANHPSLPALYRLGANEHKIDPGEALNLKSGTALPRSAKKLQRMQNRLNSNGYVSFVS